jgi:capsular exopolysaccharide synthesis family protein
MSAAAGYDSDDSDAGEASGPMLRLDDVVRALLRRLWLIVTLPAAVVAVAIAVLLQIPNRYEAVATVQIDQRHKKIVNIEGVLSDLKADTPTVESEVEVIRSRAIAARVLDELGLGSDAELAQASVFAGWLRPQPRPPPATANAGISDEILAAFDSRLKVARVRNTLLIEIRYASADPAKASRIANAIADIYIRSQIETKEQATRAAAGLLDERLKSLKDKVAGAERAVEQFKAEHNIFDADGALHLERQLARETEALVRARGDAAEARSRYEQARRLLVSGESSEAIAEVLRSHTIRLLRDELAKATRREAELATKYGPRHPEMQKVAADVAKAQQELSAEVGKISRSLKVDYDAAADRVRQIEAGIETVKSAIGGAKEMQWRLRDLEREAAATRQLYEAMLQRSKQTAETLGFQVPDARRVEAAIAPLQPASPKRTQITLVAAFGALVLAVGIVLGLELWSPGLAREEDVMRAVEAPLLTTVPNELPPAAGRSEPLRLLRAVISDAGGRIAEAIAELRHEIDRRAAAESPRVILLAASLPGEGTSVIASNLALQFARLGRRVLLVDADLRHAGLSRELAVDGHAGLAEVLACGVPAQRAMLRDARSGLHFMPAAAVLPTEARPTELLAGPRLAECLADLRACFDVIVVDAPPLLPVVDARLLADHADQIVLVMRWRHTPRELARRALALLGDNRDRLVGVVLNQAEPALAGRRDAPKSHHRRAA